MLVMVPMFRSDDRWTLLQVKGQSVSEILEIDIKPGWKKGTKITFQEKGMCLNS